MAKEKNLLWISQWSRPLESDESLLAKFAWLNDLSSRQYVAAKISVNERTGPVHELVRINQPTLSLPRLDTLTKAYLGGITYCRKCLSAGYHSPMPKLIGRKTCPIHEIPLISECRHCKKNIHNFGQPDFKTTAIYICSSCGASLVEFQNVFSSWTNLRNEAIESVYDPHWDVAKIKLLTTSGYWHIHRVLAPVIYGYINHTTNYYNARNTRLAKTFIPFFKTLSYRCYELPLSENKLQTGIEGAIIFDVAKLNDIKFWFPEVKHFWNGRAGRSPFWHAYQEILECPMEFEPLSAAVAVREQLLQEAARPSSIFPPLWAFPIPEENALICHRQLRMLVAAHSLFTILTQLYFVKIVNSIYFDKKDGILHARRICDELASLFEGDLELRDINFGQAHYRMSLARLLPSFRVHKRFNSLHLEIYQVRPEQWFRESDRDFFGPQECPVATKFEEAIQSILMKPKSLH